MLIKPQIALHLGVHKTATTYVQSRLWNSREELKKNRINYIGLDELRKRLTSKLGDISFGKQAVFDALFPFMNCNRLIISDENILGGTDAPRRQAFYPWAKQKVKKVHSGLEGCDVEIYVTIRSFPDYLVSRYSESLRHFKFLAFEDYMSGISSKNISWLPMLEDLALVGAKHIYVNDFKYVVDGDKYLHELIGKRLELSEASQGSWVKRSKISQEAYEIVKLYAESYSDQSTRRLVGMMDNHPQTTKSNPFMPFTKAQLDTFKERYEKEVEIIRRDPRFTYIPE
ncbi:hypothetical protein [Halomonas korlensis]|uniref:Sulfotransferase family protein n=1 Tax=Halomonas korlensis TaxID=463301 RepID=A0A1I7G4H4_9GAMM|nr:hypothetical protein [Halomonas korlensis]SFU43362.1 hypothetical protein SAMN04487955_102245 [Halomonas korlensis]